MFMEIIKEIKRQGGTSYYIGGFVRDRFLGIESNDIDVEIFGISQDKLEKILSKFGDVDTVGKHFGITILKGLDVDFAMPRTEIKNGEGHKGFETSVDPFMDTITACKRRDFTMNAIMQDVLTGEIIDPFNGLKDISSKIVRHIDESSFIEDPLRVFRAMQFAGRFGFTIDTKTKELCKSINTTSLPKERIFNEFVKLLLKSEKPSLGFEFLREIDVLETHFPELFELITCPQNEKHHPEGNVWIHTMMVVDESAKLREKSESKISFMLSALLHDTGKPLTTKMIDGQLTSHAHDTEGIVPARAFLDRLTTDKKIIKEVLALVENHMRPGFLFSQKAGTAGVRRLSMRVPIFEVLLLHEADHKGRHKSVVKNFEPTREWFLETIRTKKLDHDIVPLVTGKDLITRGLKPGPNFGFILKETIEHQIEGLSKDEILKKMSL